MKLYQKIVTYGLIGVLSLGILGCEKKEEKQGKISPSGASGFGNPVVSVGELTGDDKQDIVYANQTGVYLVENLGANKFDKPVKISDSKASGFGNPTVSVGDITGDGLEDIIIGSQEGIFVLQNKGNKQFEYLK